MYHFVGDCSSTKETTTATTTTTTTTEKYQLVRLVGNAISNTKKDMTSVRPRGRNLCVIKSSRKQPTQHK